MRMRSAISPTSSPPTARSRSLRVEVDGEVETQDTDGVVRGTVERFPPSLFLRETALTQADAAIRDFAQSVRPPRRRYPRQASRAARPSACRDDALNPSGRERGECGRSLRAQARPSRDLSHIFIGAAHTLGVPARYVSGYFRRDDDDRASSAATPGPKPLCPVSAGSASIRPTASARPTPMSASPSGSIRSARHRCAACVMARAPRRSTVAIMVGQ